MSDVPVEESAEVPAEFPESQTGAKLDPVDGMPVFGFLEGYGWVSRPRYVDLTSDTRRALIAQELRQAAVEETEATNVAAAATQPPVEGPTTQASVDTAKEK